MLLAQKATENLTQKQAGHTLAHRDCPACEQARIHLLTDFVMARDIEFNAAAEKWLQSLTFGMGSGRHRYIAPRTLSDYQAWIEALKRFFAGMPLSEIHIGRLREYQRLRSVGALAPPERKGRIANPEVGPNRINQELAVLIRIMKRANTWTTELEDMYQPLIGEESDIPQSLTPKQQQEFLRLAGSRSEWQLVYWYALLGFDTTLSNYEMRGLRLGDINLDSRHIMVRSEHAKRPGRIRTIPLTDEAMWAMTRLLERAHTLGATAPQHFLFPLRDKRTHEHDPATPMTYWGIRTAWEEVRAAAGVPWFSPHDVRHTAITRLAEKGVPIQVIMSLAGHLSRRMSEHYTHISEESKRAALESVHQMPTPQAFQPAPPRMVANAAMCARKAIERRPWRA